MFLQKEESFHFEGSYYVHYFNHDFHRNFSSQVLHTDVADMTKVDARLFLSAANVFVFFFVTIRVVHSQEFVRGDGIVPDEVKDNSCPYTDTVNDFSECTLDFWKVL